MIDSESTSYILRIQRDEKRLYSQLILYINIKRDWMRNTKLLFVRKTEFIGSGIIDRFVSFSKLSEDEKKVCLENNYYGKIEFAKLVRFYPEMAVEDTSVAGQKPLALHGSSLPHSDALQIEQLARAKLIIL
jgi:hypothetical protein